MPDAIVTKPEVPEGAPVVTKRILWKRFALALVVAGVSDAVALAVTLIPPAQIALDMATALVLFLILGRRWALLPGLAAEAVPGMGIFPVWILVVVSIFLYDDIKLRKALR